MHLTVAAWVALSIVAILSTLLLRLTVRVVARSAENHWDNALAYGIATVVLAWPIAWLLKSGRWELWAIAPAVLWVGQTLALSMIYQVRAGRAAVIGAVHTLLLGASVSILGLAAAVVAAYILYGKIISDPLFLLRLLLRLIGLPAPI